MKKIFFLLTALLFFTLVSCEDNAKVDNITTETKLRNIWVNDLMEKLYLWEANMPDNLAPSSESNTSVFFDKMIYKTEDNWSWISDDYFETLDLYGGISTTAGHRFSVYIKEDGVSIFAIVDYVMKDSPAAIAGIKRGDIITSINNSSLNTSNYQALLTLGDTYSIGFDTLVHKGESPSTSPMLPYRTVEITEAINFQENPIFMDTVYNIGSHKIAYFVYNSFQANYIDAKNEIFKRFKNEGVTDMIIDLRYNSGGSVVAEEHLANLICPQSNIGELFAKEIWNDKYNNYWKQTKGSEHLNTRIKEDPNNIDLQGKLIGLTSKYTASASEGLLNGLSPLLDFIQVGTQTHGKYTAMAVFPDNDSVWAVIPIIFKSTNKDNISVKGGMIPDIELKDAPLDGYQLGDVNETMLSSAIAQITGIIDTKSCHVPIDIIPYRICSFKNQEIVQISPMFFDKNITPLTGK